MKERAHRLFNLYVGEGKQALYFAVTAFLLFFGVFLGTKLSDALFVIHLSADLLPYAYGTCALILLPSVFFSIYAYNRYSPTTIFKTLIISAAIFYGLVVAALSCNLGHKYPAIWFFLKIFSQIFYVQFLSGFWTFLDQYYHFQDAKRLYTLFNSCIYLGLTCTGILIQTAALDTMHIYMLSTLLFVLVFFLSRAIIARCEIVPDDAEVESVSSEELTVKSFLTSFLKSRFSVVLMVSNLIIYLLMTTTEFGYLSAFQKNFGVTINQQPGDDASFALTRFYGACLATIGVWNLIAGWFFYSRCVLRFGVTTMVLLTPIGFLITYSGWPFDTSLLFPLIGMVVVESFCPIFEDNNFNLLLNAVPIKLKPKVRVLIESFSEPLGMLLSSLLLLSASVSWKFFALVLASCSVFTAYTIRAHYFQAIFSNLKDHALHLHKRAKDFLLGMARKERHAAEERLIQLLSHSDIGFQKLACEALFSMNKVQVIKRAIAHTENLSNDAKIYFLKLVEQTPYRAETFVIDAIQRWQEESADSTLQAAIDFYVAKLGFLHPDKALYSLHSPHLLQRAAAIVALQHSFAHQPLHEIAINRATALGEMQLLLASDDEEELVLGIMLLGIEGTQQNSDLLVDYLRHPSIMIARAAAQALYQSLDSQCIHLSKAILEAIRRRSDSEFRIHCFKALSKIGHTSLVKPMILQIRMLRPNEARVLESIIVHLGLKTVPVLVTILTDSTLPERARVASGKILAQLSLGQLNAHLPNVIQEEIKRACFYFYFGHTLPRHYEGNDLSLLKEGLLSNFQSKIDFIIQLLGASKWLEDCELITFSLRSRRPKITSQAIETLETCCEKRIFQMLYPLIAEVPLQEKLKCCVHFVDPELTIQQVLEKLETTENTLDLVLASTWKYRLDLPGWRQSLRKQMATSEEIFHHFAYELLET